jgi:hypothetical protein
LKFAGARVLLSCYLVILLSCCLVSECYDSHHFPMSHIQGFLLPSDRDILPDWRATECGERLWFDELLEWFEKYEIQNYSECEFIDRFCQMWNKIEEDQL